MEWWTSIIGWEGSASIWVKRVPRGEAASLYVAKYCSKEASYSSLDSVPYLNRTGRHYGYMRSRDIPTCPPIIFPDLDPDLIEYLRIKAGTKLKYLDLRYPESFTLLGDFAVKIGDEVLQTALDRATAQV